MEIITKGQLPGDRLYQKTCSNCRTVFRFAAKECVPEHERCTTTLTIRCPLPGCNTLTYAGTNDLVKPEPLGSAWPHNPNRSP
jgi:hypothetical protein